MSISITPHQQIPIALQDPSGNSGAGQATAVAAPFNEAAPVDAPSDQVAAHAGLVAQASQTVQAGGGAVSDLDGDGARLLALQVRQQLSAHTLSIANQAPQALLSLLR